MKRVFIVYRPFIGHTVDDRRINGILL